MTIINLRYTVKLNWAGIIHPLHLLTTKSRFTKSGLVFVGLLDPRSSVAAAILAEPLDL